MFDVAELIKYSPFWNCESVMLCYNRVGGDFTILPSSGSKIRVEFELQVEMN